MIGSAFRNCSSGRQGCPLRRRQEGQEPHTLHLGRSSPSVILPAANSLILLRGPALLASLSSVNVNSHTPSPPAGLPSQVNKVHDETPNSLQASLLLGHHRHGTKSLQIFPPPTQNTARYEVPFPRGQTPNNHHCLLVRGALRCNCGETFDRSRLPKRSWDPFNLLKSNTADP